MNDEEKFPYLRLSPEFGGTRFGPYEGLEVRLGSDPDRCHIALRADMGVHAEHVKLFRESDQNLILAPSDRTASVFLFRGDGDRPVQLTTPTAVRPGDAFTLGTVGGPRFIIELDLLPEEVREERAAKRRKSGGRSRLSKEAMGREAKRQAFSYILVMGPAQMAQRAITFIKSGAAFQPRYIFLGVAMLGGWVLGGVSMCNNRGLKSDLQVTNQRYENCEQELSFAENLGGNSAEYSFDQLAANIVGSTLLGEALEQDASLRSLVKKKSKTVFANARRYNWIINNDGPKAGRFSEWRERVTGETALEDDTQKLLVWLAATPGRLNSEFIDLSDSEGEEVCGRGGLQMTYRQAISFGLDVQADALVEKDYETVAEDKSLRENLLLDTVGAAGAGLPDESYSTEFDPVRQGRGACLYIEGTDDRTRPASILSRMVKHLDDASEDLPPFGAPSSSVSRLAKYWAADMTRVDYRRGAGDVDFSQAQVGAVLDGFDARGQWVMSRTAETIARAIVVPCLAVLQGDPSKAEGTLGEGLPSPVNCLVLDWKLRN